MTNQTASYPSLPKDLSIPRDQDGEPVFAEPWEARTFAMVVNAHGQALFEWQYFQNLLIDEICRSESSQSPQPYYLSWAMAAERLFETLGSISRNEIDRRVAVLRPDDKTVRLE